MSQIVTLKKKICEAELEKAISNSVEFELGEEHQWLTLIKYNRNSDAHIVFGNGEIYATSPDEDLYIELEKLAVDLGAEVVLEEDIACRPSSTNTRTGMQLNLGWPILCFILFILLIWRW